MPSREYIKNAIDTLPDSAIEKIWEFVTFQKFSLNLFDRDKAAIQDMEMASMSSTGFWDTPDDEVWDHV